MGTRKDSNSEIDEDAVHVVEGILRGSDWNRSKPQPDKVGLDMRVDLLEDRHPQIGFYLQIKGMGAKTRRGEPQPSKSKTGTFNKPIELEHLDYYMKLPVPVFLVLVDVVATAAYYTHVQRYVLEELGGDNWRERLHAYEVARKSSCPGSPPTKTIRVPAGNILSDTVTFVRAVRDAKGYMASLTVTEGIAYRELSLRRLDERFEVRFTRGREGEGFELTAREPVQMKMRAKLPKEKFESLFSKGLPVELEQGELTIQGSPLWERVAAEAKSFQMKQERRGFVNLVRLDAAGEVVARLDCLTCNIEGGLDEWRLEGAPAGGSRHDRVQPQHARHPRESREQEDVRVEFDVHVPEQPRCPSGQATEGRAHLAPPPPIFSGIADGDTFRFEIVIEEIGRCGNFDLGAKLNDLFGGIGGFYEQMLKARTVAKHFKIDLRIPSVLRQDDLNQIDVLFDLIRGREVPSPVKINWIEASEPRERVASSIELYSTRKSGRLRFLHDVEFPFLGESIRVAGAVHLISKTKLLTRKSDIKRQLKGPSEDVSFRIGTTPKSVHTVKLGLDERG